MLSSLMSMVKCLATLRRVRTLLARTAILSVPRSGARARAQAAAILARSASVAASSDFALAGPLGFQERVLAGHQPLAGEVRGGDLGQVGLVEQGQLQVPAADQRLDLGGAQRGDPVQVSGGDVLAQPGGGQHAPVPDQHHLGDAEPVLDLGHLGGHGRRDRRCCP